MRRAGLFRADVHKCLSMTSVCSISCSYALSSPFPLTPLASPALARSRTLLLGSRGDLPSRLTPGGHRRVRRRDVEQWRARRDVQRESLQALVQMAKEDETAGRRLPSNVTEDPLDES